MVGVKHMSDEPQVDPAQRLMQMLITKMEEMDTRIMKMETNMETPQRMLRKAGYVTMRTPSTENVSQDGFRGELPDNNILAKSNSNSPLPSYTNEEVHNMSWAEIHDMASQYQETKELY